MKLPLRNILFTVIALLYTFFEVFTISAASLNKKILPPETEAECAVLIDAKTGIVIYDKNMDEKEFPASTTKVMTALLTIEYANGNYDERITFSKNAVFGIERGSSHISMDVDETLSLNDALYAILLPSANEVSAALAEHIGGSVEGFAKMMNARAKELGAKNTNFVNPHGLDDENHYTTAHDLALIMKEAVKHDKFNEIIATKQTSIPPTEKQPEPRPLNNTNRLIFGGKYYYEYVVGGKTGYTDTARHTLVSYAKKDDVELISVILKAEKYIPYTDSIALFDYGFSLYRDMKILSKNDYSTDFTVYTNDDNMQTYKLIPKSDVILSIPDTVDISKIKKEPVFDSSTNFNPKKGDAYGVLNLLYDDNVIGRADLIISDVTIEAAPHSQLQVEDQEVFNQTTISLSNAGDADITRNIFIAIILIIFLSVLLVFSFRTYNIYKKKTKYRRYRNINNRNYRYKKPQN